MDRTGLRRPDQSAAPRGRRTAAPALDDDVDPVLELQHAAGNRAVTEVLAGGADWTKTRGSGARSAAVSRLVVQRDDPVPRGQPQGGGGSGTSTTTSSGGGAGATPSGASVPGGAGTLAAPPTTTGVQGGGDEAVGPEGQLAADNRSVTLTVVAKNFNVRPAGGGVFDFLHEPGVSIQVTPGNAPQPVVQAAIAALNAHVRRHGDDLVELSVSPQVQAGAGGVGASIQAQAELHITATFSLTASSTVGISAPGGGSDPSQVRLGGNRSFDLTWQPISIGTLFHLDSGGEARRPRESIDYEALRADARVIGWVSGQLSASDFTSREAGELDYQTMVTQLYTVMRGASGDTVEWMMHGMPPAAQLPAGLSNGLRRAAQLLAQANPALTHIRLIRVSVLAANAAGTGETVVRWIPITIEAPAATQAALTAAP